MTEAEVIDMIREALLVTLQISTPVMLIGLTVGVLIGLLQALTQIQEITLVFVPKIIAIYVGLFALLPGMVTALVVFTERIADKIIGIS
ncbi:MAG: flagellar biosynthetic protein FliQ [Alphaproteobacteria bacterium]|nr:flagellar biosynthetic protein FliQ [Alphaproteobacteria bacterium]